MSKCDTKKPLVVILSRRRIETNTRVVRQANALIERGFRVRVFAFTQPHAELLKDSDAKFTAFPPEKLSAMEPEWTIREKYAIVRPLPQRVIRYANLLKRIQRFFARGRRGPGRSKRWIRAIYRRTGLRTVVRTARRAGRGVAKVLGLDSLSSRRLGRAVLGPPVRVVRSFNAWVASVRARFNKRTLFQWLSDYVRSGGRSGGFLSPIESQVQNLLRRSIRKMDRSESVYQNYLTALQELDSDSVQGVALGYVWSEIDVCFARSVLEALRESEDVALIQSHDYMSLIPARIVSSELGCRLIYDAVEIAEDRAHAAHSVEIRKEFEKDLYEIHEEIICECAGLITVGEGLQRWYAERYGITPPTVVRNCRYFVELAKNNQIRIESGFTSDDDLVIAWWGGGYPDQGIMFLLDLLVHLDNRYKLVMLTEFAPGWAEFESEVHERIRNDELKRRVCILPFKSPNYLIEFASGADLGVIPRPPENSLNVKWSLPNKFFEMVMARLPIAVTDLPNMVDLVEKYGNGVVVDYNDAAKSSVAISEIGKRIVAGELDEVCEGVAKELSWDREKLNYAGFVEGVLDDQAVLSSY